MTNIQAINLLKGLEQSLDDYCELNDEGKAAFRMAITALELFGNPEQLPSAQLELAKNSPILDNENGELISRQAAIDALDCIRGVEEVLRSLPSAQPEQQSFSRCQENDAISRKAAIDALKDRYYKYDRFAKLEELVWAINTVPSVQPETEKRTAESAQNVPNGELILRKSAIDGKISVQRTNGVEIYSDDVVPVKYLENLPSAQPVVIRCKDCKWWHSADKESLLLVMRFRTN